MPKRYEYYLVRLCRPGGVSYADMEDYIEGAVASERGQLDPHNPLFNLDGSSVAVKRATPNRLKRLMEGEEKC